MQTDLITKVYFNEHLTHSCVGMPQGLQALSSSYTLNLPNLSQDKKMAYLSLNEMRKIDAFTDRYDMR